MPDLTVVPLLAGLFALCVAYAVLIPPTTTRFNVQDQPAQVILRNFYGLEYNGNRPFRWSKPGASLSIPVATPGDYRIRLTLQDNPAALPRRPVAAYVNGHAVNTFTLDDVPRDYVIGYRFGPREWAGKAQRALHIELATTPFIAPNDPRELGVVLSDVSVEPASAAHWRQFGALIATLTAAGGLFLVLIYGALCLAGLKYRWAAIPPGMLCIWYAAEAVFQRDQALYLACLLVASPLSVYFTALTLLAIPPLVHAAARSQLADIVPLGKIHARGPEARSLPLRTDAGRFWSRHSLPLVPVLLLAAALRAYHLNHLSLWFDEALTIWVAKQPWELVLGLRGAYDSHPPLHFAAVKFAEQFFPVASAGRILSLAMGTLTVAAFYALAVRLLNRSAALLASLVLALSPLHVWYSQEARMYVPTTFFVALSYLGLLAFPQGSSPPARWGWAALYAGATALAMYFDYSAAYALAPQVLLLGILSWRERRRVWPLWFALLVAVVAYFPWLLQARESIARLDRQARIFLAPSPGGVQQSILALTGLDGTGSSGYPGFPGVWERWPQYHGLILFVVAPVSIIGAVIIWRRHVLIAATVMSLFALTPAAAIALSYASPGYAVRTILAVTMGWALLAGAVALLIRPVWLRVLGVASLLAVLTLSSVNLHYQYRDGHKSATREVAAYAARALAFDKPLVPIFVMAAYLDAYAPEIAYEQSSYISALATAPESGSDAIWVVYSPLWAAFDGSPPLWKALNQAGYTRILSKEVGGDVHTVSLFARPNARFGTAIPLDGTSHGGDRGNSAGAWHLSHIGTPPSPVPDGTGDLVLKNTRPGRSAATLDLPAIGDHLYIMWFDIRAEQQTRGAFGQLSCLAADGTPLETAAPVSRPADASPDAWRTIGAAVICPANTTSLRVSLVNESLGEVRYRNISLQDAAPHAGRP